MAGDPNNAADTRPAGADSQRSPWCPVKVAIDPAGTLWVADAATGQVLGLALEMDGRATVIARIPVATNQPSGLAITRNRDALFVADASGHVVRRFNLSERDRPDVPASNAERGSDASAADVVADLDVPSALALDESAGVLYVAVTGANQIWRVDRVSHSVPTSAVPAATVLAGTGRPVPMDGLFVHAGFARPTGLVLSADRRRLYVIDNQPASVRMLDLTLGQVSTLATLPPNGSEAATSGARGQITGRDIALTPHGLVIADPVDNQLYGVNLRHGTVSPLSSRLAEQSPAGLPLCQPSGVAFHRRTRSYVVADRGNGRLMLIAGDTRSASEVTLKSH
ncbi:MAG: hypothetical protein MJE77_05695 [Proteobacteria bacterium]|nr:hypothetical protein [Pseudomonadota bacterium]